MIPVVDGHHHIWRQADLPWLAGPMQPRIFGPYEPIRRDYPIEEYRADIAGLRRRQVGLRAGQLAARALTRTRPHGCSGRRTRRAGRTQSSLTPTSSANDVRPQLDRLSRYPLVRGVRMQLHWHENPQYRFAARPDLAADPDDPAQHRPSRRLWLELRPPGLRAANGRRRRSCRVLPEGDVCASARRHA